jgi:hypothetical protein
MQRRLFIQSGLAVVAASLGSSRAGTRADTADRAAATLTFYDPRFPKSREAANEFQPGSPLRPIQGDASDLAILLLTLATAHQPLIVAGVTTESIPFCLQQMPCSSSAMPLQMQRLDGDLFVWRLTTGAHA